jgi:hypothetical protein
MPLSHLRRGEDCGNDMRFMPGGIGGVNFTDGIESLAWCIEMAMAPAAFGPDGTYSAISSADEFCVLTGIKDSRPSRRVQL